MIKCPLNPLHILPDDRLQVHLFKCMKNYPDHVTCPYNALHKFVAKEEYEKHILVCPEKVLMNPSVFYMPRNHGDLSDAPYKYESQANVATNEDW